MNRITFAAAAIMAAAPAIADEIEINGAALSYTEIGDGAPVLVMHGGLGLSHHYLRPYFDVLAETHTVVFYDHFGNGNSARPDDYAEMDFPRLVGDGVGLMAALGHDQFVLIGHSYGGFVAQALAVDHSDVLSGLVLIDTVPAFDYAPTVSGTDEQMAAFGRMFTEPMADDADFQATWSTIVPMYFAQWTDELGAELDARTVYSGNAWNAAGALLGTFNMLEALPGVDVPTLVVSGAEDPITPPGPGAERIAELTPNATLAIIEGAAHYPFIEQETAFFEVLSDWMDAEGL